MVRSISDKRENDRLVVWRGIISEKIQVSRRYRVIHVRLQHPVDKQVIVGNGVGGENAFVTVLRQLVGVGIVHSDPIRRSVVLI
ncbi:hypothetical protein SDC9_51416 [bioreactor metagenome]|uniref:Uncharacterized protein n=1 Tax=bioreactor metagenome TaxID=1076179 RepID=A0A644WMV4_9ZZZZ